MSEEKPKPKKKAPKREKPFKLKIEVPETKVPEPELKTVPGIIEIDREEIEFLLMAHMIPMKDKARDHLKALTQKHMPDVDVQAFRQKWRDKGMLGI